MMTTEQRKVVTIVYDHLMEKENRSWNTLDDCMNYLEYLNDDELHREADCIYAKHANQIARCEENHPREHCFVPLLVDAVGAILELYKETNDLHINNRYILHYYLAMDQSGYIVYEG